MERTIVAFTTLLLASAPAHAAHPPQALVANGTARDLEFVAGNPRTEGRVFARQVLPPTTTAGLRSSTDPRAASRIIYLNRDGVVLLPGDNDARTQHSTIVSYPVAITAWEIDDETWSETVACMRELYAEFDVTITDQDPGDAMHIEAVFGGHPSDVGLPDNVAGVSPFTTDCGVIENSIVFTFTDVLPDDPRLMCEVMAQEIAHSFGLDHQLTPEDPMTYLDYDGDRSFQNEMADCGEFESRECGINGSVCRDRQNSVALLASRLGRRGAEDVPSEDLTTTTEPEAGGCHASGSGGPLGALALTGFVVMRRRRQRRRA